MNTLQDQSDESLYDLSQQYKNILGLKTLTFTKEEMVLRNYLLCTIMNLRQLYHNNAYVIPHDDISISDLLSYLGRAKRDINNKDWVRLYVKLGGQIDILQYPVMTQAMYGKYLKLLIHNKVSNLEVTDDDFITSFDPNYENVYKKLIEGLEGYNPRDYIIVYLQHMSKSTVIDKTNDEFTVIDNIADKIKLIGKDIYSYLFMNKQQLKSLCEELNLIRKINF